MKAIKPKKIGTSSPIIHGNSHEKLTAAEMGKLWAMYVGNSMTFCVLTYFLKHVEDEDIKELVAQALDLCKEFMQSITSIFEKDNVPIPVGFGKQDVNEHAPRLFEDTFYVHYLKYTSKAGMSIYNVALSLMYREDVKSFLFDATSKAMSFVEKIKLVQEKKGMLIKPPVIPVPERVEFAQTEFLNGFFSPIRPLHALEITHLYDNVENDVTSKALIMAFAQVAKDENIRELFAKGRDKTVSTVESYMKKLHEEDLPSLPFIDDLVTDSTYAPFSDKLMLFHKIDMFSMKIRAFGNSMAVNGRRDLAMLYMKSMYKVSLFIEDAANIMIEKGWMEEPPHAKKR